MVLENNGVNIDSDNEILERVEYNVGTVSYTHLDVYKRQEILYSFFLCKHYRGLW